MQAEGNREDFWEERVFGKKRQREIWQKDTEEVRQMVQSRGN